ncbi:hypothetical protein PTSG_09999 [Salpingoeca rosetta]|uniref:Uncharacterized protein n=1 Tax=Salpingoeca rosetta (strain ATCC 50818 / BSB-021) TaxID=946362 RepID=F2UP80_SALR5|nr:uncharacterized protein PTSG_09999 [Salpingoeca rosetta]EGD79435.1 hypothetical protein PTSG_09999 [Salpingoeca rosetta]|eukprot:XP_004988916.1 hypothetical protein PTSG_09999 [Salpingoeca rosetta]
MSEGGQRVEVQDTERSALDRLQRRDAASLSVVQLCDVIRRGRASPSVVSFGLAHLLERLSSVRASTQAEAARTPSGSASVPRQATGPLPSATTAFESAATEAVTTRTRTTTSSEDTQARNDHAMVLRTVLSCLPAHMEAVDVQVNGMGVLRAVVEAAEQRDHDLTAAWPMVLKAMETHSSKYDVQLQGCLLLKELLRLHPNLLPLQQGVAVLSRIVRTFRAAIRVQHAAADTLLLLSRNAQARWALVETDVLVVLLEKCRHNPDIIAHALRALSHRISLEDLDSPLLCSGIVSAAVGAMSQCAASPLVQQYGMGVLQLAASPALAEDLRRAAVEAALQAMHSHADPSVRHGACMVLLLTARAGYYGALPAQETVQPVMLFVSQHCHSDVGWKTLTALAAIDEEHRHVMCQQGVAGLVTETLHCLHPEVLDHGVAASEQRRAVLIASGHTRPWVCKLVEALARTPRMLPPLIWECIAVEIVNGLSRAYPVWAFARCAHSALFSIFTRYGPVRQLDFFLFRSATIASMRMCWRDADTVRTAALSLMQQSGVMGSPGPWRIRRGDGGSSNTNSSNNNNSTNSGDSGIRGERDRDSRSSATSTTASQDSSTSGAPLSVPAPARTPAPPSSSTSSSSSSSSSSSAPPTTAEILSAALAVSESGAGREGINGADGDGQLLPLLDVVGVLLAAMVRFRNDHDVLWPLSECLLNTTRTRRAGKRVLAKEDVSVLHDLMRLLAERSERELELSQGVFPPTQRDSTTTGTGSSGDSSTNQQGVQSFTVGAVLRGVGSADVLYNMLVFLDRVLGFGRKQLIVLREMGTAEVLHGLARQSSQLLELKELLQELTQKLPMQSA